MKKLLTISRARQFRIIGEYRVRKQLKVLLQVVKRFIESNLKKTIQKAKGIFQHPKAHSIALHFHHVSLEEADILVHVAVANPNWFSVYLVSSEVVLESEGRKIFEAKAETFDAIASTSTLTLDIPIKLMYREMEMAYPDMQPGMLIPALCRADLTFIQPLIGLYRASIEKRGSIAIPTPPEVCIERISFSRFSFAQSDASVELSVFNPNPFSVAMVGVVFTVVLGEVELVRTTVGETTVIQSNDLHTFDAPISFHPREFGRALWHTITAPTSSYEVFGTVEAETYFGTLHLPFHTQGLQTKLETVNPYEPDDPSAITSSA